MGTKRTYIFTLSLSLILFIDSCASPPIKTQTTPIIPSNIPTETTTPIHAGLSIRETERVETVFAIQTASTTPLPTPSETNSPILKPTSTIKPVSKNDVLISYTRYAGDGVDEIRSCLNGYFPYRFVLYRDGRLIIFDKTRYLETKISQTEIDSILSEIEITGFSSITRDGDQYIQNAPTPLFMGGWGSSITVKETTVSINDSQSDYLIEPVIKTLDIIESYRPQNLKPYIPESITFWVFSEQESLLESFYPTPEPSVLYWSSDSIDLNDLVIDPIAYLPQDISGSTLLFLMEQFKYLPAFRRVEQNGQYYLVLACPNFPQ